jgi:hypothetical protein
LPNAWNSVAQVATRSRARWLCALTAAAKNAAGWRPANRPTLPTSSSRLRSRSAADARSTSLGSLLPPSANYQIQQAIDFVQEQYFLRPGDEFPIVAANARPGGTAEDAVRDWSEALEGIKIEIDYLDIFGKAFRYARVISTRA